MPDVRQLNPIPEEWYPEFAMAKETCRQCKTALPFSVESCPLCGLRRPRLSELTFREREFLKGEQCQPADFQEFSLIVDPTDPLMRNITQGLSQRLSDPDRGLSIWMALIGTLFGALLMLTGAAFPLSFMLFWPALTYLLFQVAVVSRSVYETQTFKRLNSARNMAPYSVLFKMELQVEKLLVSLRSVVGSILERDWSKSSPELQDASASFIKAAQVVTERLKKYSELSLEISSIIWRNNVYAILDSEQGPQEKAVAIGAKCREAEAILMRHRWLSGLSEVVPHLEEHIRGNIQQAGNRSPAADILERFHLTMFGPVEESVQIAFERTPEEIPFKGRVYWHQRLPPFPLEDDGSLAVSHHARELLKSLADVRKLKIFLEEQMALNCVTRTISDVSPGERGFSATLEAEQISRDFVFEQYLDVPKFRPDPGNVNEAVDKLLAEARVTLGTEDIFEK
jgi:hypothetical protein